jgi:hypothetical protein
MNFKDAEAYCAKHNMILAEPNTIEEFEALIVSEPVTTIGIPFLWLGGKSKEDSKYYWQCRGEEVNSNLWGEGFPSGNSKGKCVIMRFADKTAEGKPAFKFGHAIGNEDCMVDCCRIFCQRDCRESCPIENSCCSDGPNRTSTS